jgi:hypothetical protein
MAAIPQREPESQAVIERVCAATGLDETRVRALVEAFRDIMDALITDNYTLWLPGAVLGISNDIVTQSINAFLDDPEKKSRHDDLVDAIDVGELEDVASLLGLDEHLVERYPPVGPAVVLAFALDWLGYGEPDRADEAVYEEINSVLMNWTDRVRSTYRLSSVGLEQRFEDWLAARPETLNRVGLHVSLESRQLKLPSGRRLDLLFRFDEDCDWGRSGDLLVVELKAGRSSIAAVEQLRRYVDEVGQVVATDGQDVTGILIADGSSSEIQTLLDSNELGCLSMTALGYRDLPRLIES